jgi:hypothetical protein
LLKLSLARNFPRKRIEWACRLALEKRIFRYKILRRLLEREKAGMMSPLIQSHGMIRELSEYSPSKSMVVDYAYQVYRLNLNSSSKVLKLTPQL